MTPGIYANLARLIFQHNMRVFCAAMGLDVRTATVATAPTAEPAPAVEIDPEPFTPSKGRIKRKRVK